LKITFSKIKTFPKEKNLKVWFISPEFTDDFRKLLRVNNLIIKSFVNSGIINK
jgi:AKAP7 2'5' RNA ligase-like domain